jgi:hypothetical protein
VDHYIIPKRLSGRSEQADIRPDLFQSRMLGNAFSARLFRCFRPFLPYRAKSSTAVASVSGFRSNLVIYSTDDKAEPDGALGGSIKDDLSRANGGVST